MDTLKSILLLIAGIMLSLMLGKWLAHIVGGLPGSLYGLLIFCGMLKLKWINADKINPIATQGLQLMPVVFLPVCVGVMNYTDLIRSFGLTLLFIGVVTTLLTLSVVGLLAKYITRHYE